MKRFLAVIIAVFMLVSLVACTDSNDTDNTKPVSSGDATSLEAYLWKLSYDAGMWQYAEEDFTDSEDYSSITLYIPDGEDSYYVNAEITASIEDAEDFRGYLTSYGFDQYEYAVNNAYELTDIGGVDCLMQEGNYWGEPCLRYFGRVESANATVFIEIIGEYSDESVDALLAGLEFSLTDIGNEDAPWYWEGEAFSAQDMSATAGSVTVNSKWVPFDESFITAETFEHAVAVAGDKVYIVSEGVLKQYAFDGNTLTFEKDIETEGEYEYICATDDGSIWVSNFSEDLLTIKDGTVTASYEDTDYVAVHPSGSWGISWFSSNECTKLTFSGGTAASQSITFAEVDTIMQLLVDKNYIYVCGSEIETGDHKVFVYNADGVLQKTLCDENGEGLGSITFVTETKDGFVGMDGNMREVVFWSKDGAYVGSVEDTDLFSTSYPWFCSSALLSDGSILTIMTEDRADESAMELVAFTLSGF